jgi:hypothetical protein
MDALDDLPLDILLALRDAVADPTEEGRQRAAQRAADAGFYLECLNPPEEPEPIESTATVLTEPIAMEPAPADAQAITLDFRTGRAIIAQ